MIVIALPRRRWLQFSLRGFLVVLTIGCVWLGWKGERAHKRGEGIDAISDSLGIVIYLERIRVEKDSSHVALDLSETPVDIFLFDGIDEVACSYLPVISNIRHLYIFHELDDTVDLQFLNNLVNVAEIHVQGGVVIVPGQKTPPQQASVR